MADLDGSEGCKSSQGEGDRRISTWLEELQRADQTFHRLMSVEVWSLAQSMDELHPGFWTDYMKTRQAVAQQQIKERRNQDLEPGRLPMPTIPPPKNVSDFAKKLAQQAAEPAEVQALFKIEETDPDPTFSLALAKLPHLIRVPVIRRLPFGAELSSDQVPTLITCWLTRHFLVQELETGHYSFKRLKELTIQPGQTVLCRLGFQLKGSFSAVRVQLVTPPPPNAQMFIAWVEENPDPTSQLTGIVEATVRLTYYGAESHTLSLQEPFCYLQFFSKLRQTSR